MDAVDVGENSTGLEEIGRKKKSGMYATLKSSDDSGAEETRKV